MSRAAAMPGIKPSSWSVARTSAALHSVMTRTEGLSALLEIALTVRKLTNWQTSCALVLHLLGTVDIARTKVAPTVLSGTTKNAVCTQIAESQEKNTTTTAIGLKTT